MSLNIGTLTGKTDELVRVLRKGAKSCDTESERGKNGYKILYFGYPPLSHFRTAEENRVNDIH